VTDRILDFSESGAVLSVRDGLLAIAREGRELQRIPLGDIAVIMASHRQVVFTQSVVAALAKAGGVLVCCDERHHPVAMLLPFESNFEQSERFRKQAEASLPVRKRLWQEITRAKIAAQSRALTAIRGEDGGLLALSRRVRSGDAGNTEAVAAVRYWPLLFMDGAFRRGNEDDPRNTLLNYGYAVMRAAAARALCAAGLHPTLGVHHANKNNAFCLADDFMEPLRPLIDRAVARYCEGIQPAVPALNKTAKAVLISCTLTRYRTDGEQRTLFDILARTAGMLAGTLTSKTTSFRYPDLDACG
jgi:CRISPR-associated protein Cas1